MKENIEREKMESPGEDFVELRNDSFPKENDWDRSLDLEAEDDNEEVLDVDFFKEGSFDDDDDEDDDGDFGYEEPDYLSYNNGFDDYESTDQQSRWKRSQGLHSRWNQRNGFDDDY